MSFCILKLYDFHISASCESVRQFIGRIKWKNKEMLVNILVSKFLFNYWQGPASILSIVYLHNFWEWYLKEIKALMKFDENKWVV